MSAARFIVGDALTVLRTLPDASVDVVVTSPPFLSLRSYLPADHPDKAAEMGSEATPGAFLDALLDVVEECRRVLAPHGSLAFELGDSYSGSGGGGDYLEGGLREGQAKFDGSARRGSGRAGGENGKPTIPGRKHYTVAKSGQDWPLPKSLVMVPESFRWALAYGRNPFTGRETPRWRVRNVVRWARQNPPVGALCVDDQTEALTPDGWKTHHQLSDGDLIAAYDARTDSCRFVPAKFVQYAREGESMVSIDKKSTSQLLTEDHRVWTRTRKSAPHVRLARDLTNGCDTLLAAPFDDVSGPDPVPVEWAGLLGWFVAEGSLHHRQARIRQSLTANPAKVAAIRALLAAAGADWTEDVYRQVIERQESMSHKPPYDDLVTFNVKGPLAEWLNLHHKRLPMAYVTTWPERLVRALFDGLIDGDGHRRKNADGVLFHQKAKPVAEAVQVLALRLGYRASLTYQAGRMQLWQVTMSNPPSKDRRWTRIRKWDGEGIRRETYTGTVWCPMVETGLWLARRNGKPFITGNSDKCRPATSDIVIACMSATRYFDMDAERTQHARDYSREDVAAKAGKKGSEFTRNGTVTTERSIMANPAGAPLLDHWWVDDDLDQDAWLIPTHGYAGSHYATFPSEIPRRLISLMAPRRVCSKCHMPSRREVDTTNAIGEAVGRRAWRHDTEGIGAGHSGDITRSSSSAPTADRLTTGWSSCGCPGTDGTRLDGFHTGDAWRRGMVLDPFVGSGTTLACASGMGRDSIGIDLDHRNADLARERVGMFLEVDGDPELRPVVDVAGLA